MRSILLFVTAFLCHLSFADVVNPIFVPGDGVTNPIFKPVIQHTMEIPVTPFSNMASGYQATNPGFRAIVKDERGNFVAGGALTMEAVIRGFSDDASQGSAYGRLVMVMSVTDADERLSSGQMDGSYRGTLDICMARDWDSSIRSTECKNLSGNIHPERPFQWLNKSIDFTVENGNIKITRYNGYVGEGGTSRQLSLAVFHAVYGFCAPGKAFKDYQSPLVLDLDHNGKLDLVNVWDEKHPIRFDLNGSGEKIRTGWVAPQDGLLFFDRGTGCVENGTQFFGEFTNSNDARSTYANGFEALAEYLHQDLETSISVSKLSGLKVWQDKNLDGVCQANESAPASKFIKEIRLSFTEIPDPPLTEDNEIRLMGQYVGVDGKSYPLGDVWFKQRRYEKQLAKKASK